MCGDTTYAWVHHHCDDFKAALAVAAPVLLAEPLDPHKIKHASQEEHSLTNHSSSSIFLT